MEFRDRVVLESIEEKTLASFGAHSARSRGRRHPEREDEWRTAHQRDRDRVVHSEAFRRLQHKTQVFVVHEGDFYRTRITHTIEVAQISRSLAAYLGANQDLAETIALLHDLGHPPFGHAGERELDRVAKEHGLAHGFDHNLQCLRIIEDLEQRYAFPGLNLTWEAREGIARHATPFDTPEAPPEFREFKQPGVEAQIASIADVLAYVAHDLEDALYTGFFSLADVDAWRIPLVSAAIASAGLDVHANVRRKRQGALTRAILGRLVRACLEESGRRLEKIGKAPSADDVRRNAEPVVALPDALQADVTKLIKELLARVYRHPTVEVMCDKGCRVLRACFEHFVKKPGLLPLAVAEQVAGMPSGGDGARARAQVILDFMASLTDRGALELHERLFDPRARVLFTVDG
jgi:dGTPase